MRRYRDIFKATSDANNHFDNFFKALGFTQMQGSYIEFCWRGTLNGRSIDVCLSNIGNWEVSNSIITVTFPTKVKSLFAAGYYVPPLRRIGMVQFHTLNSSIKCYSHDRDWGNALLVVPSVTNTLDRLEENDFLEIIPEKLTWVANIANQSDDWLNNQLNVLSKFIDTVEQQPNSKPAPSSIIRKHASSIAIGIGVLVVCGIAAVTYIIMS